MRLVGKLAPTGVVSAAGGAGLGAMLGGGIGAFMAPVVGTGARALATRATLKNARRAREAIVGRGLPGEAAPDVRGLTGARAALLSQIAQPDQDSE